MAAVEMQPAVRPRRYRRWLWLATAAIVLLAVAYSTVRIVQAARAGTAGRASLLAAEKALRAKDTERAETLLRQARGHFAAMHADISDLGPLLPVAKVIPLVRIQVRAAQTLATVGEQLAAAGVDLAQSAQGLLHPARPHLPLGEAVDDLRSVDSAATGAVTVLDSARSALAALDGYRLLGPFSSARTQLESRLAKAQVRGHDLTNGLSLLLDIVGANGPRRYLLLTQNPDEIRPTGGYIGTYGLIVGDDGHVSLAEYGPSGTWAKRHPQAAIPPAKAPFVFEYATPPQPQTLSNVNTTPDWPTAAKLAAQMFVNAGQQPLDGVLSVEPQVLIALVKVYGSIYVPKYHETVTAMNVQSRLDFYTHSEEAARRTDVQRKNFIAELAHATLVRTLHATGAEWVRAASALQSTFDTREGMAWSSHPAVQQAIAGLGWDGTLPPVEGDFFADAEFEFAAKNGAGVKRIFDHSVTVQPDGSGVSATELTLRDTLPSTAFANKDTLSYLTPYGPVGATLAPSSDQPVGPVNALSGHPAAGWVRAAEPLGSTSLHVVWNVPHLLQRIDSHHWLYALTWLPQPGHTGDVAKLRVTLPPGWTWTNGGPPPQIDLDRPYAAAWEVTAG